MRGPLPCGRLPCETRGESTDVSKPNSFRNVPGAHRVVDKATLTERRRAAVCVSSFTTADHFRFSATTAETAAKTPEQAFISSRISNPHYYHDFYV